MGSIGLWAGDIIYLPFNKEHKGLNALLLGLNRQTRTLVYKAFKVPLDDTIVKQTRKKLCINYT